MALESAADWRSQGEAWMLEKLGSEDAPATVAECQRDQRWWPIFGLFAESKGADESFDFLNAVDDFKRVNNMTKAGELYREFLAANAPRLVNLYADVTAIRQVFDGEDAPLGSLDMFDEPYAEIQNLVQQDTYPKFLLVTKRVRAELAEEAQPGEEPSDSASTDSGEVGEPQQVELTRAMIQDEIVDSMNQAALKDLQVGVSLNFWQVDDLVILHAPYLNDETQPYLSWARANAPRAGMITMKEKGGAFNPGCISVSGYSDKDALKAAIARVSKKKVEFE